ncbi:MAG TPA: CoA transferase [Thermoanaerobaculia bacterium]|jgi:crotonobetainyl-CoA:carnitine CoA-transferase CaiB-like acyl-CoA transferase
MRRPPLEGVVVLDLSRVLAGPLATMLLADLGARVIKVEDPRGGDVSRGWKPPALDGEAAYYLSVNRRKESAAVDLGTPEGQEFVRRWAAKADVLVENFLPGALEKRGIGVDALRALNPRLVACSISGAGDKGPEAGAPGFDLLAQGATGLMSITGPAGGAPHKIGVALVDVLAGWAALAEILAALHARERDGIGAHVKTNLVSTGLAALVNVAGSALVTGREAARHGNSHATIEPYRAFEASDGGFLLAVGTDRQFRILCETVIGRPDLAADPRFATNAGRVANRAALVPVLEEVFRSGARETWLARCREAAIPAGPVSSVLEALHAPQARALESILVTARDSRTVPTVRPPFFFEEFSDPPPAAPPRLGEDTERLFAEVGLPAPR